jgi:hypothetical protein
MTLKLPQSKKALDHWDEGKHDRAAAWDNVKKPGDVDKAEDADTVATMLVQLAYFEDTKHLNNLSGCRCMSVYDIRDMVRKIDP